MVRVIDLRNSVPEFSEEQETWKRHKDEWMRDYPGKYLVIRGDDLVAVLDTPEEVLDYQDEYLLYNPAFVRPAVDDSFADRYISYSGPSNHA